MGCSCKLHLVYWYRRLLSHSPPCPLTLVERTDPTFPASPPSCPICAQSYPSISSCAAASPVLANFSQIIFNPGAFISIIECSCTDTFQSAFPQCVDCFQQTNQTAVIASQGADLPSILSGLRSVCALASTLLGNVTATNGEQVNGTPITPTPTPSSSSAISSHLAVLISSGMALTVAFLGSTLLL
ncbi:hypothetical protein BU17DRAFT_75502 [Hysterangium stoloniferum]|nr:hypothetical protein BU17DRAFT_75502 [Hysterangium stoloniferum]